jgi:putative spermidine/putrescine transport system ATP-binding protein
MRKWDRGKIRRAVASMLDLVRLEGHGNRRPHELSGGQQQRVAVARALAFEPKLLLMDEPLGALDRKLREEMQQEFRAIHRRTGVTVVYVTHDQDEAMSLSSRVAVMSNGRIVQSGSPESLYECPTDAFVATFVGQANLLPVSQIVTNGHSTKVRIADLDAEFSVPIPGQDATESSEWLLLVRPEAAELALVPDAGDLEGKLEDVVYLGDRRIARVRLGSNATLVVRCDGAVDRQPGDAVGIRFRRDKLRLVRATAKS